MVAEQEIVMEAERNQKIEIEKLEESRNLAQKEMEKLQTSLKVSNEELGQAKMRMDSAIAEKEAALNQINSMKVHFEVSYYFKASYTVICLTGRSWLVDKSGRSVWLTVNLASRKS